MVSTTRVMLSVAILLVVITVSTDTGVSAEAKGAPAWKDIKGQLVTSMTSQENMKSVILIVNWLLGIAVSVAEFVRGFYHTQIQSEEQLKTMFKTLVGPPLKQIIAIATEMGA